MIMIKFIPKMNTSNFFIWLGDLQSQFNLGIVLLVVC